MNDLPQSNRPQPSSASPQKIANRYILKEIIGEGSYSIVFRGYDTDYQRKVAIKELKSQGLTSQEADEAQQLFFNEINILKQLRHPNIPEVYDFFLFEGRHYMVMQWVEGENLLSLLEDGETLLQGEALYYMGQIVDALVYLQAEERRIVYKDLKPSNIIVNEDGHVWIIDFGTARFYSPEKKKDTHVLGTPGYAPPEAYTGVQTDLSADVYSLGATFYHLVTGQEPFQFKFNFQSPCKFKPELTQKFSILLLSCLKPRDARIPDAVTLKRLVEGLGLKKRGAGLLNDNSLLKINSVLTIVLLFSWFFASLNYINPDNFYSYIRYLVLLCPIITFSLFSIYLLLVKSHERIREDHNKAMKLILGAFLILACFSMDSLQMIFFTAIPILVIYGCVGLSLSNNDFRYKTYISLILAILIYIFTIGRFFMNIFGLLI